MYNKLLGISSFYISYWTFFVTPTPFFFFFFFFFYIFLPLVLNQFDFVAQCHDLRIYNTILWVSSLLLPPPDQRPSASCPPGRQAKVPHQFFQGRGCVHSAPLCHHALCESFFFFFFFFFFYHCCLTETSHAYFG